MDSRYLLVLAAFCIAGSHADINETEYIMWKKADIHAWHKFFPSRALEEEQLTIIAALAATESMIVGLNSSLNSIVAFQNQELQTAQQMMEGTDAEGCVEGISDYLFKAIDKEIENHEDCAADAMSKYYRQNNTWVKIYSNYQTAYQRALYGIDLCAKTYPNKDSYNRLTSCVASMYNNYFNAASTTYNSVFPSPTMEYFQSTVVGCASNAALAIASKGWQLLQMLFDCAALDDSIDLIAYKEQLYQWKGYNDTLTTQIKNAQDQSNQQVGKVEVVMQNYYQLEKQAMEKYVIESRGLSYYVNRMYVYLDDYFNTVTATSVDNPEQTSCVNTAVVTLNSAVYLAAGSSLQCDVDIVNATRSLIGEIYNIFLDLNAVMPNIGNVALFNCFSEGYIYAPNTIRDYVNLVSTRFDIEYTNVAGLIEQYVNTLDNYYTSFYGDTALPCANTTLRQAFLDGDSALYNLQRCMYINTGSIYSVTTPNPSTTTPSTSTSFDATTTPTTSTTTPEPTTDKPPFTSPYPTAQSTTTPEEYHSNSSYYPSFRF